MASSPRIDELKKKFDENPRRYFAPLANEYRKFGDLEQAIQLCRAYLPQQPGHMSGHIVFGQALFEAGKLDESRGVFETALGLDPENLIALRHLGDIAKAGGDTPGARQWYQRVLDADPRNEEIAAQIAAIDAAPPVAPPSSKPAGEAGDVGGWGDINPEAANAAAAVAGATAAPASGKGVAASAPVPRPEIVDLESLELRDSMSVPVIKPSASPAPSASRAPNASSAAAAAPKAPAPEPVAPKTEPEFERDGEGAFALPSPEAAAARPAIGVERSEEIDLRPSSSANPGESLFGATAEPESPAPAAKPAAEKRDSQSFGSSNQFGFEVMEFVPPARDSDPTPVRNEAVAEGFGVPFTGETNAKDETPAAFVTETMAELYLQQGFTQEALQVYRQLLAQNPRDDALRDRIAALEKGSRSSVGVAAVSDKVFDEVQRRHRHEPETIRAFFGGLMRRRVLQRYDDSERAGHTRPESTSPNGDGSVWGTGAASGSSRGDESHRSPDGEDGSSELAFIVPAGAAPPPGMAPGDENRAEYRDEGAGTSSSRALAGIPVLSDESPRTSIHDAPTETYETPPPAYEPPANHGVAATSREAYRDEYAQPAPTVQAEAPQQEAEDLGSISLLFGEAGVEGGDEQAAKVLSGAFPTVEGKSLAGRPAERAKNELSLDNVFREADRKTGRNSGGFSFDQFFSDGSGGAKQAPRQTDPSGSAVGGPDLPPDDDVAQFNDWLTGLKKK